MKHPHVYKSFGEVPESTIREGLLNDFPEYKVADVAEQVRKLWKMKQKSVYKIGHYLLIVKSKLVHGEFQTWIKKEFPFSYSTANSYMNVANAFDSSSGLECFSTRVLNALASPKISLELRQKFVAAAKKGKKWTVQDVRAAAKKQALKGGRKPRGAGEVEEQNLGGARMRPDPYEVFKLAVAADEVLVEEGVEGMIRFLNGIAARIKLFADLFEWPDDIARKEHHALDRSLGMIDRYLASYTSNG